jgi:hypothetical protein
MISFATKFDEEIFGIARVLSSITIPRESQGNVVLSLAASGVTLTTTATLECLI